MAMAKLAGIQKSVRSALDERVLSRGGMPTSSARNYFRPADVAHYFHQAAQQLEVLQKLLPELYGDFHKLPVEPEVPMLPGLDAGQPNHYSRNQMERLARDIDQIFEIRANSGHIVPLTQEVLRKVFISHGRSKDWYEVQAHIEKDLKLNTLELAQEPSIGQTVIEKLETNSDNCDSAVIVMSGDDADADGLVKVRENVMHEIGYFQGKYGRSRVVLLHEEGVNVPSNLAGIVYVAYPKGKIDATFGKLDRELKAMYPDQ